MYCTCTVSLSNAVYHISGAGIYADNAASQYVDRPIANNGLILSAGNDISVNFISNSSQLGVGVITLPDGDTRSNDGSIIGGWWVRAPFNRPGTLRFETSSSLTSTSQGIYTVTIPDSTNNMFTLNVGLYPSGFDGELLLLMIFNSITCCISLSPYNSDSHHFRPDLRSCTSYCDL